MEELEESIFSVPSPVEQLDYEELKIKEIAEEMGYSESNVKNTLYETRNRLRGHLKREGYLQ